MFDWYHCIYPESYVGEQPSGTLPVVAWWLFCTLHKLRSACQEVVRKTNKIDIELRPQWLLLG